MSEPGWLPLFLDLVRLMAPSLQEKPAADFLKNWLQQEGFTWQEDQAGQAIGGNADNIFVTSKGNDPEAPWITFLAHMDCVEAGGCPDPLVLEDRVESRGTILGADNRAAVCLLLELLKWHRDTLPATNLQVVFTVAEECGLLGAAQINKDLILGNIKMGGLGCFIFDSSKDVGHMILRSPRRDNFRLTFHGRPTHAGVEPEKGLSAIKTAGLFLSLAPLGRLDLETTCNIGKILGGTDVNTVPAQCTLEGECRSFNPQRVSETVEALEVLARATAETEGAELDWACWTEFEAYQHKPDGVLASRVRMAFAAMGIQAVDGETGGGSDANVLNQWDIPAMNLGLGYKKPHSHHEVLPFKAFKEAFTLCRYLTENKP